MTIVVEDGTGRLDSESYASVADADAYWTKMGSDIDRSYWQALSVSQKEVALRRATQYIDTRFRFPGAVLTDSQALSLPTSDIPWPVKNLVAACAEMAIRSARDDVNQDVQGDPVKREKVGPIETEYDTARRTGQATKYPVVHRLLYGIAVPCSVRVLRA